MQDSFFFINFANETDSSDSMHFNPVKYWSDTGSLIIRNQQT